MWKLKIQSLNVRSPSLRGPTLRIPRRFQQSMAPRASLKRKQPGASSEGEGEGSSVTVEPAIAIAGAMVYKDVFLTVPLDHNDPDNSETIRIHAREVRILTTLTFELGSHRHISTPCCDVILAKHT
jgi:hypothetical protein